MNSRADVFEGNSYLEISEYIRGEGEKLYSSGYNRIIFTNGCFDILHLGHLQLLSECRKLAGPKGAVVVGVNTDASVGRLKGPERPINREEHRCLLLASMKMVDHVVTFEEDTPIHLIEALRPDVIVKGSDYEGKDVVGSNISTVILVPITEGYSTTSFIERIKNLG